MFSLLKKDCHHFHAQCEWNDIHQDNHLGCCLCFFQVRYLKTILTLSRGTVSSKWLKKCLLFSRLNKMTSYCVHAINWCVHSLSMTGRSARVACNKDSQLLHCASLFSPGSSCLLHSRLSSCSLFPLSTPLSIQPHGFILVSPSWLGITHTLQCQKNLLNYANGYWAAKLFGSY